MRGTAIFFRFLTDDSAAAVRDRLDLVIMKRQMTDFMAACEAGDRKQVVKLLEEGANPDMRGSTLHGASFYLT